MFFLIWYRSETRGVGVGFVCLAAVLLRGLSFAERSKDVVVRCMSLGMLGNTCCSLTLVVDNAPHVMVWALCSCAERREEKCSEVNTRCRIGKVTVFLAVVLLPFGRPGLFSV